MKIAIVEDDKDLAKSIWEKLQKNGYEVIIAHTLSSFKKTISDCADLFIIDLDLWRSSGYDVIWYLREDMKCNSPIIIISCHSDVDKKLKWFRMWVDDYMCKPFSPKELIARVWTILRRSTPIRSTKVEHNWIIFDLELKETFLNWIKLNLSRKEIQIVEFFLLNKWKIIKKDILIKSVWWQQDSLDVSYNTINVTMCKLKGKLWKDFKIETLIWMWYILR